MVSLDAMDQLEGAITKINAQVISVGDKIDSGTKQREESLSALGERITENESQLDELEDKIMNLQDEMLDVTEILQELNEAQDGIADEAVKAALKSVQTLVTETAETVMTDEVESIRQ